MASSNWVLVILLFFSIISDLSAEVQRGLVGKGNPNNLGRRALMGFKETPNGGNITYDCSPSGPCVPCAYSEKNDEKYRCSETGYRIPLKCVDAWSGSKVVINKKAQNHSGEKGVPDESSGSEDERQAFVTYRSCIPAENEEKLSVLGFEGIMLGLLLVSGSAIYLRRKRVNIVPSGQVRAPSNSRF